MRVEQHVERERNKGGVEDTSGGDKQANPVVRPLLEDYHCRHKEGHHADDLQQHNSNRVGVNADSKRGKCICLRW